MSARRLSEEQVINRLRLAGCVAAEEEAAELMSAATDYETLTQWIAQREEGVPLAWITGTVVFGDHVLTVLPGVFVPRMQSEELARRAADALSQTNGRAVDLCTGAGAIAAYLRSSVPAATVIGVDIDEKAVACARRNGVTAIQADLAAPLCDGVFDVVTAIAPYVPTDEIAHLPRDVQRYEPRRALDGGADGLDVLSRIVASARRLLRHNGWLFVEVGANQDERLRPALSGFSSITPWRDEDGDLRGIAAQKIDGPQ